MLNEQFLWASLIWGSLGSGYLIYGWRQKSMVPLAGGLIMIAASYFASGALWMSVISLAALVMVHVLLRRGF